MDQRQGWRGPISNINLSNYTNDELLKYLNNLKKQLPKNRMLAAVTKVSKNIINVLFQEGTKTKIEFKNASWARPQTIKNDDKNRLNIYLGKNIKALNNLFKMEI